MMSSLVGLRPERGEDRDERRGLDPARRGRLRAARVPAGEVATWTSRSREEQDAIRELAARDPRREVTRGAREGGRARAPTGSTPRSGRQLAEANLLGVAIPEAHGGMGIGFVELCVLLEEVGRAVAPGPWLATLVLGALPLAEFGTEAQPSAGCRASRRATRSSTAALEDAGSADGARARDARAPRRRRAACSTARSAPCRARGTRRPRCSSPRATSAASACSSSTRSAPGVALDGARHLDRRAALRRDARAVCACARTRGSAARRRRRRDRCAGSRRARSTAIAALQAGVSDAGARDHRRLRERARAVRRADRLVPGRAAPRGRRLHRPRGDALDDVARGLAARRRPAGRARRRGREVLGRRGRLAHREREPAPARRPRLRRRLSDPPLLPVVQGARARRLGGASAPLARLGASWRGPVREELR